MNMKELMDYCTKKNTYVTGRQKNIVQLKNWEELTVSF